MVGAATIFSFLKHISLVLFLIGFTTTCMMLPTHLHFSHCESAIDAYSTVDAIDLDRAKLLLHIYICIYAWDPTYKIIPYYTYVRKTNAYRHTYIQIDHWQYQHAYYIELTHHVQTTDGVRTTRPAHQ